MNQRYHLYAVCVIACLTAVSRCLANPIPVPRYAEAPLSEIQIIDSLNWSVEVDVNEVAPKLKSAGTTDTFTLFSAEKLPPAYRDSLRRPMVPEMIGNGIIVLTQQHFPGLRLKPGWTVVLGLKNSIAEYAAPCPADLSPANSLICKIEGTNTFFPRVEYIINTCPSIGVANPQALGRIYGTVRGADSVPLPGIRVVCSPLGKTDTTGIAGDFSFPNLDNCNEYTFRFYDNQNGNPATDTAVGPHAIVGGQANKLDIQLNYLPSTAAAVHREMAGASAQISVVHLKIRGKIVLAVSDWTTGQGAIHLFSASGRFVRSLPFSVAGPGTYTISWDGRDSKGVLVPRGTYFCRINLGRATLCRDLIVP